ncbi:MAG TPA: zf-HC2 domain-containing protein [Blastocatellia bacterium]|nr:zf-HC2 domain-containing protein [Blastocatellia bacterium]
MTKHLSAAQIVNYQRRMLAPAELLGVDDHLAECAECRRLIESTLNNDVAGFYAGLAAESAVGPHLSFDQSAAYVDGLPAGEERRMIEDHFASCAICAPLIDDLRAFRNEIAPEFDREYSPTARAAKERVTRAAWHDRIAAILPASFVKIPLWIYAAPLLALLATAVWIVMWSPTAPQIVHTTPTPSINVPAPGPLTPEATPEAAPMIVRLNDGGSSLALDAQGRLVGAGQWPSEYRQMAAEALSNQKAPGSPLLAGLRRPGGSLMGAGDDGKRFAIIAPSGKVLLSDRPAFKWTRLDGADSYVVEIYDAQFNLITSSPALTGLSWTSRQLARGQVYSWQVKAVSGGQEFIAPHPTAPQAKFRILDQTAAAEIARARRDYASSHLLLGLLYARAGLLAEAEQEFRALQKANPDSGAARKLLASVSGRRR